MKGANNLNARLVAFQGKNGQRGCSSVFPFCTALLGSRHLSVWENERESGWCNREGTGSEAKHGNLELSGSPRRQVRDSELRRPEVEAWTAHWTTSQCKAMLVCTRDLPEWWWKGPLVPLSLSWTQVVTTLLLWPQSMMEPPKLCFKSCACPFCPSLCKLIRGMVSCLLDGVIYLDRQIVWGRGG